LRWDEQFHLAAGGTGEDVQGELRLPQLGPLSKKELGGPAGTAYAKGKQADMVQGLMAPDALRFFLRHGDLLDRARGSG
jgi:hypothetical protein